MRSNIQNTSFVIGIVLSCAYHTFALVALTMQAHSLNAPSSRRIIGYQCKNPVCGKVFANLFAYDQHRNHATKAGTFCTSLTMRVELTGVRRVDRPIPDLHARPSTGLNRANSAKCMLMRNHCGCCSASTQSDEHVAVYILEQFRPCSKFG
jgi:hypothetical protein